MAGRTGRRRVAGGALTGVLIRRWSLRACRWEDCPLGPVAQLARAATHDALRGGIEKQHWGGSSELDVTGLLVRRALLWR